MFKFGVAMLGVGVICFVALVTVLGPLGPCINEPQTAALFGGLFFLAVGAISTVLAVIMHLSSRRHRSQPN
jgi:hypothetical protein